MTNEIFKSEKCEGCETKASIYCANCTLKTSEEVMNKAQKVIEESRKPKDEEKK